MNEHLKEAYLAGHNACGLKVGDKVRIMREAEDHEQGWENSWVKPEMDKAVGEKFTIIDDLKENGFSLNIACSYRFPWFVLEKVEGTDIPTSLMEGLDFGCNERIVKILVGRILEHVAKEKHT